MTCCFGGKKLWLPVVLLGIPMLAAMAFAFADDEGEREVSMADVPEAIQNAFRGVEVDEVEVEMEDGAEVYEVVLEIGDDDDEVEVELELTADGVLLGVEIERDDDEGEDDANGEDRNDDE